MGKYWFFYFLVDFLDKSNHYLQLFLCHNLGAKQRDNAFYFCLKLKINTFDLGLTP
jgi:hypothetical protein